MPGRQKNRRPPKWRRRFLLSLKAWQAKPALPDHRSISVIESTAKHPGFCGLAVHLPGTGGNRSHPLTRLLIKVAVTDKILHTVHVDLGTLGMIALVENWDTFLDRHFNPLSRGNRGP